MYKLTGLALAITITLLCTPTLLTAQEPTAAELEQRCEEMREARIAPLREAEIEKCKAEKTMEPARCESYYKDYGDATRGAGGKYTERMFNDLGPCVKAREMQSKSREGTVSTTRRGETTTDVDKTIKELTTTPEQAAVESITSQGKVTPTSRDGTLATDKRDSKKTETSPASSQETETQVTEKAKSSRDSTLSDTKRDSTSGSSSRQD